MAEKWVWLATVGGRGELRQQVRFFFSWRRIGRLRGNWGHGVDSEEGPPWTGTIFHF